LIDHDALVAQTRQQRWSLFVAHRDPFEVVVGKLPHDAARVEIDRLQAAFQATHGDGGRCVRVDDAMRVSEFAVKQAVLYEPGTVDVPRIVGVELVTVNVDLDQR